MEKKDKNVWFETHSNHTSTYGSVLQRATLCHSEVPNYVSSM